MTTYTVELQGISPQEIDIFSKQNNVNINEKVSEFIASLLKKSKTTVDNNDTTIASINADIQAIRALRGKYRPYAKQRPRLTVEKMDNLARQKFAEKWLANDVFNRSDM